MPKSGLMIGFVFILKLASHATADVYKWIDDAGTVHYSDSPPGRGYTQRLEVPTEQPVLSKVETLRRQKMIEQANKYTNARIQKRREREQQKRLVKMQDTAANARCMELRRQLDFLQYQMPVYLDENGKYRVKWQKDTYQGKRVYIDDAARVRVKQQIRGKISSYCGHEDDVRTQRAARTENYLQEQCQSALVKLSFLERPSARSTDDEIEKQRQMVSVYCRK